MNYIIIGIACCICIIIIICIIYFSSLSSKNHPPNDPTPNDPTPNKPPKDPTPNKPPKDPSNCTKECTLIPEVFDNDTYAKAYPELNKNPMLFYSLVDSMIKKRNEIVSKFTGKVKCSDCKCATLGPLSCCDLRQNFQNEFIPNTNFCSSK